MESLKAVKAFAGVTNYVAFFGFVPYKWPKGTCEIVLKKSRRILSWFKLLWLLSEVIFMVVQLYRVVMSDVKVPFFKQIHVMYTTAGISIVAYNVNVVYNDPDAIPALMNNLLLIADRFYEGQRPSEGILQSKAVVTNLRLLKFACTFISLTFALPIIRNPGDTRFLTSLLSEPGKVKLPLRIVVGLYHMYAIATEFAVFLFSISAVTVFVTVVVDISQALRIKETEALSMKKASHIHRYGRELQVLMEYFNAIFCRYTITLQVLGIVTIVVNSTLALMYSSIRGLVIASAFFVITLFQYKSYGTVYEESRTTMETWRLVSSGPWFRRYCKSCRPLRVNLGTYYFADRTLTLTILSIILNNTASLGIAVHQSAESVRGR